MLDAAVIQGGAAAVGGLAVGLGMAWFSEQQVEQGEQRGSDAVSEATRAKMSAMFMEDEVLPDTTLDDTVSRMEAALAAAKGEAIVEEKVEEKPASSIDDGWRCARERLFLCLARMLVVDLARVAAARVKPASWPAALLQSRSTPHQRLRCRNEALLALILSLTSTRVNPQSPALRSSTKKPVRAVSA